jgi:predicted transcriptional regulator
MLTMTKILDKGIEAIRSLPAERQDMAGELLLSLAKSEPQYRLTAEQLADVKLAIAEADRGEFATDAEMAESWKKFGR